MADTGPIAALDQVVVDWRSRAPLGPLDLSVAPGEIVALVGASGAGKSTTLRLLAGLEQASSGRVIRAAAPGRTGFVFQSPTLMPWADAQTNVALPLELSGASKAEARARAAEALTAVGLGQRLTARPAQLSGGMAMRVSLARALVTEPRALLLDEPFSALDPHLRTTMRQELLALQQRLRVPLILITHDVEDAKVLGQHVVRMQDGRLQD